MTPELPQPLPLKQRLILKAQNYLLSEEFETIEDVHASMLRRIYPEHKHLMEEIIEESKGGE